MVPSSLQRTLIFTLPHLGLTSNLQELQIWGFGLSPQGSPCFCGYQFWIYYIQAGPSLNRAFPPL